MTPDFASVVKATATSRHPKVIEFSEDLIHRGWLTWALNPQLIGDTLHRIYQEVTQFYATARHHGVPLTALVYLAESLTGPVKGSTAHEFVLSDGRFDFVSFVTEAQVRDIMEPLGYTNTISDLWFHDYGSHFVSQIQAVPGVLVWNPGFYVVSNDSYVQRDLLSNRLNGQKAVTIKMIGRCDLSPSFWVKVIDLFKANGYVVIVVDDLRISSYCAYPHYEEYVDYITQELRGDPQIIDLTLNPSIPQTMGAGMVSDWRMHPDTMLAALFSAFRTRQCIVCPRRTGIPERFIDVIVLNGSKNHDANLYLVSEDSPTPEWECKALSKLAWGLKHTPNHSHLEPFYRVSEVPSE